MTEKRILGQYYTVKNPFNHVAVHEWYKLMPDPENLHFIEPFAGANNIIALFDEAFPEIKPAQWEAYDISPEAVGKNQVPEVELTKRDTIKNPVKGDVVVTNPPYLAKNSASKNKFVIDFGQWQNLYEVSLEKILANADYVCAIIPESFITRKIFTDRLFAVVSITENLFDDTGIPVCLALWGNKPTEEYKIYSGETCLGTDITLQAKLKSFFSNNVVNKVVKFNDPKGLLGVQAIDNTKEASLRFVRGDTIAPEKIKHTSRHVTRVSVYDAETNDPYITEENLDNFIEETNKLLHKYRELTDDVFLTSSKGIREDGKYRRRLDFKTIKMLINSAGS